MFRGFIAVKLWCTKGIRIKQLLIPIPQLLDVFKRITINQIFRQAELRIANNKKIPWFK